MKKIIILHGWTKNLDKWKEFIDGLEKKGIKTELPQIPGLTGSSERIWDLNNYVKWLKDIVDKEKGKVILIGHSNGGRIALAFTNQYPQKVEKLILIDSAGIYHNELPLALKRVIFRTLAKFGTEALSRVRLLDKRGNTNRSFITTLKKIFYKIVGETDYNNASVNMKQTMLNLLNSDKSLRPEEIQIPTLIIWGKEDNITPLSDGILMNNLIKNSKLEIVENARHSPQFTHPNQVTEAIINNLAI